MKRNAVIRRSASWRAVVGLSVLAAGLWTGCTTQEVDAILSGVQVATTQLTNNQNDRVTFGDWLSSELNH